MKRRVWIKVGDVVLVAPWDFRLIAEAISSGGTQRARPTGFVIKVALQPDLPQMTTWVV